MVIAGPANPWPRATASTTVSRHHAVTSSIAAQAIAVLPRYVPVRPRSAMIRARTGNAVTLIATAVKSANDDRGTCGGA